MKKVLLSLLIVISLFSCKEELPKNISSALDSRNHYYDACTEVEKIIFALSDSDIEKLSKDSIFTLTYHHETYKEFYEKYDKELKELLKYNPEYSDHPDMKLKNDGLMSKDINKLYDNLIKLDRKNFSID